MHNPYHISVIESGFIFEKAPFLQCHASTIEAIGDVLVAAWFGGTHEKHPDVGIWTARYSKGTWHPPVQVADGVQDDGTRYPCWNPVLYARPDGILLLFYKVGPNPGTWWGLVMQSEDAGQSWSTTRRLPDGILGPIKNKPVLLANGDLLSPSSTEDTGWLVHLERSRDLGQTWERIGPLNDTARFEVIQPSILTCVDRRIQLLCRSKQNVIVQCWSNDNGDTWSTMGEISLPNPNSGIDAVSLANGKQLLVYNHSQITPNRWGGPRTPLNVALSEDGQQWDMTLTLETQEGEYSYPAVIQAADGRVHTTYTWQRTRIKHVVLDAG